MSTRIVRLRTRLVSRDFGAASEEWEDDRVTATPPVRPATSVDVARVAGVSRTTVSRILRGDEAAFPEATRRRVHDAVAKLDYRPSSAGRSLVTGHSDTIVVLLPDVPFGSNLQAAVDEIVATSQPHGGNVVIRFASSSPDLTVAALLALRPIAVLDLGVLGPADVRRLAERGVAVVPDAGNSRTIESDGGIARLQIEALSRRGPRSVWYVGVDDGHDDPYSTGRFAAIREICRSRGLLEPRRIDVRLRPADAREALQRILEHDRPVALACYDDDAAVAMLAAARDLGADVPRVVAVIGVNASPAGQFWSPRLTTITVDIRHYFADITAQLSARLGWTWRPGEELSHAFAAIVEGETV
jgi:DNA-binding LacI/PurR family transcriptional regulator